MWQGRENDRESSRERQRRFFFSIVSIVAIRCDGLKAFLLESISNVWFVVSVHAVFPNTEEEEEDNGDGNNGKHARMHGARERR